MPTLNEADTRTQLIDPALHTRGWGEGCISREITAGKIDVVAGQLRRAAGRADYLLRLPSTDGPPTVAVALIEAKAERYKATRGLQQGKGYTAAGKRFNVPFVYASNGHLFVEYDVTTGQTSAARPLAEFPTPDELQSRYEEAHGFTLEDNAAQPLLQLYAGGERQRYYQDAAIRATLEKIAAGKKRALISMATGSGKTHVAVHLLKKIADAGQLRRALFVCDRTELRDQARGALHNVFGDDAAQATTNDPQKNARIIVATYQTLGVATDDDDASFLTDNYPENYFSHIIIDEAHRSAWSKWSTVLTRNSEAVQIGLTATPRSFESTEDTSEAQQDRWITRDNIEYFGDAVYEYPMSQGMEDGYLAYMEIRQINIFLEGFAESEQVTGIHREDLEGKDLRDSVTGKPRTVAQASAQYKASSFESRLVMPDRVKAMCSHLFGQLLETGKAQQKTIIFCASDDHADAVAIEMNNLYNSWRVENDEKPVPDYAFKCTAAGGKEHLSELRGSGRHHYIAATVDLLTTGVDVPALENIVFFKNVKSPIAFYQMLGRGTRLTPTKMMFRVYDYTNATRLFGRDLVQPAAQVSAGPGGPGDPHTPQENLQVHGIDVRITNAGTFVLSKDENGKDVLITLEAYKDSIAESLLEDIPGLDEFREVWIEPGERHALIQRLNETRQSVDALRALIGMEDYDLYDVLADVGYQQSPRTRVDRAETFTASNSDWLDAMPDAAARTIRAIASQFAIGGTEELENLGIFQTPAVRLAGGTSALNEYGDAAQTYTETKRRMFSA